MMNSAIQDAMFVPYGVDCLEMSDLPAGGLAVASKGGDAPVPLLAVAYHQRGLRLNSTPMRFPAIPEQDKFEAFRIHLTNLFSPWDATARRVMSAYFSWVGELVDTRKELLEKKVASYEGLFGYADFRFSAPMPLPRAHLFAPAPDGQKGTADDFLRADIAFFPGGSRVVVFVSDDVGPRGRRLRDDRLISAGIQAYSTESFLNDPTRFAEALCPDNPDAFWMAETMPCGLLQPYVE